MTSMRLASCHRATGARPLLARGLWARQADVPELLEQAASATSLFSWTKQWYAVAAVRNLDSTRPYSFSLLDRQLVIWKDNAGSWSCLEDRCPHRAVPLSEGKVWADGTLACSYHGWRFDGRGACKSIPQAASAAAEASAAASRRACAVSYPVQEQQGMLFVFGEGGPAAHKESKQHALPLCSLTEETERQGSQMTEVLPYYTRDLPYDYSALVENLVDPSHVPWSHHGVMGNRDTVEFGKSCLRKSGELSAYFDYMSPFLTELVISVHPPSLVKYSTKNKRGGLSCMTFWVTPLAPGRSRITLRLATNLPPPLPLRLLARRPAWVDHVITRSAVFDGDNVFLAGQDRLLAQHSQQSGATWRNLYYMPTAADTLVAAVRNWLDTKGGGGPFGSLRDGSSPAAKAAAAALLAPAQASQRQLLDRYHQHTVHCASCMRALRTTTLLRTAAACAAAVSWAAGLLPLLSQAAGLGTQAAAASLHATCAAISVPAVLLGAAFTAAWWLLGRLRDQFLFVEYHHHSR